MFRSGFLKHWSKSKIGVYIKNFFEKPGKFLNFASLEKWEPWGMLKADILRMQTWMQARVTPAVCLPAKGAKFCILGSFTTFLM